MGIATTLLLITVLFATGKIFEAIKRLLVLLLDMMLKILNLFGFHINVREPTVRTSNVFNSTFKDIRVVKRSRHNSRMIPSVNIFALIVLLISALLVAYNIINNSCISQWLYSKKFLYFIIKTQENMDTTFIAVMFSVMSFSFAKLMHQWKDTSKYRKAKKEIRLKNRVLCSMTSKELLDVAKDKDNNKLNQIRVGRERDENNS